MALLSAFLRDQRLERILPHVAGHVLDLGCGPGLIRDRGGDRIESYAGIDRDQAMLDRLAEKYPDATFHNLDLDSDEFPFEETFDVVVLAALIEHIFNQKHLFTQIVRCLKPGGSIVLTTPTPFGNDIVHRIGAKLGLFAKAAAEDHIVIYNKKRFEILAREMNLSLETYAQFQFFCNQLVVLRKAA